MRERRVARMKKYNDVKSDVEYVRLNLIRGFCQLQDQGMSEYQKWVYQ